jgi:hypothetical protein
MFHLASCQIAEHQPSWKNVHRRNVHEFHLRFTRPCSGIPNARPSGRAAASFINFVSFCGRQSYKKERTSRPRPSTTNKAISRAASHPFATPTRRAAREHLQICNGQLRHRRRSSDGVPPRVRRPRWRRRRSQASQREARRESRRVSRW